MLRECRTSTPEPPDVAAVLGVPGAAGGAVGMAGEAPGEAPWEALWEAPWEAPIAAGEAEAAAREPPARTGEAPGEAPGKAVAAAGEPSGEAEVPPGEAEPSGAPGAEGLLPRLATGTGEAADTVPGLTDGALTGLTMTASSGGEVAVGADAGGAAVGGAVGGAVGTWHGFILISVLPQGLKTVYCLSRGMRCDTCDVRTNVANR